MTKFNFTFALLVVFISACSTTKDLPPGKKLYTGAEIKITDKNVSKSDAAAIKTDLATLPRPKPNGSLLGLRVKLYIYEKTKTTKKKGLKHYLNTHYGEEPVFSNEVDLAKNSNIIQNRLQNKGYFLATVSGDTVTKNRTAKAVYSVQTGPAYQYRRIIFPKQNDDLDTAVAGTAKQSLLKPGERFDLDVIVNERLRIDARLKEEGFFYFGPDDLIMRIDSNVETHKADVYVTVKPSTPDQARWIYSIRNIYVYPDYSLKDTSLKLDSAFHYRWYNVIDPKHKFRPFTFANSVLLHPGDTYNRDKHNSSLNRFIDLGPFKFVKNRFEDVTPDSPKLDIYYFLTPYPKKSLQAEILARQTSANYSGTQIDLTFRNRNTFKGAELFALTLFASSDVQFGQYNNGYSVYQFGIQPSLTWPRFVGPFDFKTDKAYIPKTILTGGYTLIDREKLYRLNSFNISYGYQWKPSLYKQSTFNLLNLTFVDPENVSQLYQDSINKTRNPALAHVINKQFTFGPSYEFLYTNTTDSYKTNTFYYDGKVSESGLLVGLITRADTPSHVSKIANTPFNEYIKLENEFRFYHKLGQNSKLATRFLVGLGMPLGNSTVLPYSQQFFIGGANSLRGFQAHSLGPGGYVIPQSLTTGTNYLPDESGDIKIEANVEYRPKLFSILEGALFVDAGNIWLFHSTPGQPNGAFSKNFLSQIAADAGFGLRFNLSVLILRTDLGFPILKPNFPQGANPVFNLAIGYPF